MSSTKPFDAQAFLTHAIWHCLYGSQPTERTATEADLRAAKIMTDRRSEVADEYRNAIVAKLGVCAKCREGLTSMRGVRTTKDGARFHGRCWRNDR